MHSFYKYFNFSAITRLLALSLMFLSSAKLRAQDPPAVVPVVSGGVEKLLRYVSTDASGYYRYRLDFDEKVWTVYYNNTLPTPRWEFQECEGGQCAILSEGTSVPSGKYPPYGAVNWTVAGSYVGTSHVFAITGISRPASPVRQLVSAICVSDAYRVEFALGASYPNPPLVHLELSDANGSFANPTDLGSSGTTDYTHPQLMISTFWFSGLGLTPGGEYKLRLRYFYNSYHYSEPFPLRIGPPTIEPVITQVGTHPAKLCHGVDYTFEHNDLHGAAEYQWTLLGYNVGPNDVTTSKSGNTITINVKPSSYISALRVTAVNSCGQIFSQRNFAMAPNFAGTYIEGQPILMIDEPQTYRVENLYGDPDDVTFNWEYSPPTDIVFTDAGEYNARNLTAGSAAVAGTLSVGLVSPGCPAITIGRNIQQVKKRRQTVSNGAWGTPATWEGEVIPGPDDVVSIRHQVDLSQSVVCQEMRIDAGGLLRIEGGQLEIRQSSSLATGKFRVDGGLVLDGGTLLMEAHSMVMGNASSWAMSGGAEVIFDNSRLSDETPNIDFSEISGNLAGFTETGDGGKVIVRQSGMTLLQGNPGQHIRGHYQVGDGINRLAQDGQQYQIRAYSVDRLTLAPRVGSVNVYLLTAARGNVQRFHINELTISKSDDPYISNPGVLSGYTTSNYEVTRPSSLVISGNLTNHARLTVNAVSSGSTEKLIIGGIPSPDGTTLSPTTFSTSITGNGEYSVYSVELMNQQGAVMSLGSNVTFTGDSYPDNSCQCYRTNNSNVINNATLNLNNYILKSGLVSGTGRIITGNGASLTVKSGSSSSPFNVTFPVGTGADSFTPLSVLVDRNGIRELGVGVSSSFSNPPLTAVNVGVQWNISGGLQPLASATLTFTWREEDESAGFDRSSVAIARYNTTTEEWEVVASGRSATTNPDGSFSVSVSGVTHFSAWGVFDSESALPVSLANFTVAPGENRSAYLHWTTTAETNTSHFDIERSKDAKTWQKIGEVKAVGESNGLKSYAFTDSPSTGGNLSIVHYYRLKMVDLDGSYKYSPIRSLMFESFAATAAMPYPNPAADKVYLQNLDWSEVTSVTMYSLTGNEVTVFQDQNTKSLDVRNLYPGIYLLRINMKNSSSRIHRVVVGR